MVDSVCKFALVLIFVGVALVISAVMYPAAQQDWMDLSIQVFGGVALLGGLAILGLRTSSRQSE